MECQTNFELAAGDTKFGHEQFARRLKPFCGPPTRRVASWSCGGHCFPSSPSIVVHARRGRASSTPSRSKPTGSRCIAPFVPCRVLASPSCVVLRGAERGLPLTYAGSRAAALTKTAAQDSVYHHSLREWSIIPVHATLSHCMYRTLGCRCMKPSCVVPQERNLLAMKRLPNGYQKPQSRRLHDPQDNG